MFNLRVYGILINEQRQVLVSDELIRGMYITKFPGGGLEFGEGPRDCLVREFKEELDLSIETLDHIYTTDHFQLSAFNTRDQIISIYYKVKPLGVILAPMRATAFEFDEREMKIYEETGETETFRLINWEDFSPECLTLPIDKIVADLILNFKF